MAPSQAKEKHVSHQHSPKTEGRTHSPKTREHDSSHHDSSKTKGTTHSPQTKENDTSHHDSSKTKDIAPSSQAKGHDASHHDSSNTKEKKSGQEEETALEKHASFFDRNKDGMIYPWETYQGFRAIGLGRVFSAISCVFIHIGVSYKTRPGEGISPLFPIVVKNIHLVIHGSDTDVYDKDGRFVESKFEEIFEKHAHTHQNALTYKELLQMLKTNREPKDIEGWISSFFEWKIFHRLCKDKNGLLSKKKMREVFDGSIFVKLEKERLEKLKSRDED